MTALRIILHVGADKTGTTAVQRALAAQRTELAERGIWYPDLDGRPDHRCLATERSRRLPSVPPGIETVVLSSEAFWPLSADRIEKVLRGLPDGEVIVAAYVREPVDHAEAAFAQRLRMSRSERELRLLFALRTVPPAVNPIVARTLRRLHQLERWAQVIADTDPSITLVVRAYPAPRLGETNGDTVTDLCRAVGLEAALPLVADRPNPRPNPTPSLTALHASVLVRVQAGPEAQTRFLDVWGDASRAVQGPLLPASLRRHLRTRTRPALARLNDLVGGLGTLLDAGEDKHRGEELSPAPALDGDAARALDGVAARALLNEVWPSFPVGDPGS